MEKKYIGTPVEPSKMDEVLVTLSALDSELAKLDRMETTAIMTKWNLIEWRKRRNAVLNATDKLANKEEL
jgi:hypothetical protein